MKILIHSKISGENIAQSMGLPEYSYYFAKREFVPALQLIGEVLEINDPSLEVDTIFHQSQAQGEPCIFLAFTPPHLMPLGLKCPSVCVFAWEFSSIPQETWADSKENNWADVLLTVGQAVTHSNEAAAAVRDAVGDGYPIIALPSPLWDKTSAAYSQFTPQKELKIPLCLDSNAVDLETIDPLALQLKEPQEYHQYAVGLIKTRDAEIEQLTEQFRHAEQLVNTRDKQLEKLSAELFHAESVVMERDTQLHTANAEFHRVEKLAQEREQQLQEQEQQLQVVIESKEYAENLILERDKQLQKANEERLYAEKIVQQRDGQIKNLLEIEREFSHHRATRLGRLNAWLLQRKKTNE